MEQIRSDVQKHGLGCTTPPLRDLAARGVLRHAAASQAHCLQLRAAAYAVAMPLVWERHTRPLENVKGHRRCASGVVRLAPDCHDGFTDDLESVVTALLSYRQPIVNLEGWISARMAKTEIWFLMDDSGSMYASWGDPTGIRYAAAWGPTKKDAEQRAAQNALSQLAGEPVPFQSD